MKKIPPEEKQAKWQQQDETAESQSSLRMCQRSGSGDGDT